MRDFYGDPVRVYRPFASRIILEVHDGTDHTQAALTPKKARRLAKALKKAAKRAEKENA